jgi:hypothetical protein
MKSALLCLALLCLSSLANAQALWRDVPAGLSPAEVSGRISEAQPAMPATLADEPRALLEIPSVEIARGDFAVRFLFENERLVQVALRADTGSAAEARALAQRLYSSLRSRYGLELSNTSRGAPAPTTAYEKRWQFRRTTVNLQVVEERRVLLTYGVQSPRRSDPL